MNLPSRRIGDRYRCFFVVREDKGWGGPYGMTHRPVVWECEDCQHRIRGDAGWQMSRMADHHECGHAPCARAARRCCAGRTAARDSTP